MKQYDMTLIDTPTARLKAYIGRSTTEDYIGLDYYDTLEEASQAIIKLFASQDEPDTWYGFVHSEKWDDDNNSWERDGITCWFTYDKTNNKLNQHF